MTVLSTPPRIYERMYIFLTKTLTNHKNKYTQLFEKKKKILFLEKNIQFQTTEKEPQFWWERLTSIYFSLLYVTQNTWKTNTRKM